jgi:hypothetical protein
LSEAEVAWASIEVGRASAPVMGASGRDISGNGTKFVIPCSVSGTVTVSSPIDH